MSKQVAQTDLSRSTRTALLISLVCVFLTPPLAATTPFVPRKSPDFKIAEPSGDAVSLSALRGKVVVMEFFFLQSSHCIRVAQMLNRLNTEMGSRGFQPVGVVFDPPNAPDTHGRLVGPAVDFFKLSYPVGYASKADVDFYLNRQRQQILMIPQLVVIDRSGTIRAVTGGVGGDTSLENENSLRALIDKLLNEDTRASAMPRR